MKSILLSLLVAQVAFSPVQAAETILFDGSSLEAFDMQPGHEGHWRIEDGVLHYDGKSEATDKNLWSREAFGDLKLTLDWRWAENASHKTLRPVLDPETGEAIRDSKGKAVEVMVDELDSGIYLRGNSTSQVNLWNWPCGSGEVYGYRMNQKLPQRVRAALTPRTNADKPIGQWNHMVIELKGDRLDVHLNDKHVIRNAQLPGVPKSGKIALQHHGSAIEFKDIRIEKL